MQKKFKIILIFIVFLVALRIALPYIVLKFANNELAKLDGYNGHIEDIDISLYRGAYVIDSIYINKVEKKSGDQTPFISAKAIDLSVQWAALLHGRIVGELIFTDPILHFTKDKTELAEVKKDTADFHDLLSSLMPLKINNVQFINGKLKYSDLSATPKVNIEMTKINALASNLSNVQDTSLLPSRITAKANVYEGTLDVLVKLDALAEQPLFDLNVNLVNTNLPELNPFFKAYANIDVNKGVFSMYSEVAAKNGKFTGYVKPIITDLDVLGPEDRDDKFLDKVWEGFVGLVGSVIKNRSKDQVATKIPLNGEFNDAKVGTMTAIVELLRNAFIRALYPSIDNQITLKSVDEKNNEHKGFFKRLFSGEKKSSSQSDEKEK